VEPVLAAFPVIRMLDHALVSRRTKGMRRVFAMMVCLVVLVALGCSGAGSKRSREVDAGLRLDAKRLHELGLTRKIPRQVRQACAEARRLSSVRVICPKLIPDIPLTKIEGLWGSITFQTEPRVYMVSLTNAGGFFNRPLRGVEHWIVGGGKARVVEKWILTDFVNEGKGDPVLVRTLSREGRRIRIYRFPTYPAGGPNGSHWAAFVRVGDELFFASLHGKRYVAAAIEMALDLAEHATREPR
jgi:hypothetical protein